MWRKVEGGLMAEEVLGFLEGVHAQGVCWGLCSGSAWRCVALCVQEGVLVW